MDYQLDIKKLKKNYQNIKKHISFIIKFAKN
jgi:hypothetical protein